MKKEKGKRKKEKSRFLTFSFLIFNFLASAFPALAETAVLGVVKNPDNSGQWPGISTRLQASGVSYCVVDWQQVKQAADLGGTRVLFLPNVETLTATQLQALQEWMRQGGKLIVSGPVGTLSQPDVRSSLRSLLGAYWGFALSTPSNLEPLRAKIPDWLRQTGLSGQIRGGVVIPSGLNSQTAAIWNYNDNPPAVVTTEQSVFFGWRWGVDAVASVDMDSAWLRAALNRYAVSTPATTVANGTQQSCLPSASTANRGTNGGLEVPNPIRVERSSNPTAPIAAANQQPINIPNIVYRIDPDPVVDGLPTPSRPQAPAPNPIPTPTIRGIKPSPPTVVVPTPTPTPSVAPTPTAASATPTGDVPIAPPVLEVKPGSQPLSANQVTAMRNELENLIGRFQSALLAANTIKVASVDTSQLPTVKVASTRQLTAGNRFLDSAVRAVDQAKTGLQTFLKLVNGQDYTQARQVWLQARRLLWDNYPTENQSAQPEVRAMWLDRGTIVNAKSEQDLGRIFDQMAASGINTVFFETVNAGYTIYPSNVAPEQNPMTRGWDPLAAAVKLAHERGMELHAWVWVFATGNQRHNILLNKPEEYPGPVIAAHPDWAIIDNQRRLFHNPSGKVFLDPTNPEARSYLLDLMDEIVSRYQVDGIQLDYIRYPFQDPGANQNHGYGRASREAFKQLAGVDPMRISPSDRALWQKWTDFRVQQVDSFVAAASQRLRAKRPELIISAAVFPLPREERLQRLQQNWEEWAQRGDVDLMVPMTYALETNQLQQIAQPLLSGAGLNATLVLPGIRLLNLPDAVAIDQIQLLRDLPAGGYSLFAFENLNQGLQTIFRRARNAGSQTSSDVLPYRQPFRAAASRYAALQREWNFMLANNQIQIPEPVLSQWRKQIDELAGTFNQLADQPTSDRLLTAREQLTAFRSQFRQLMQLQAVEQPYQVQAWENRLSTLERLLGYGERVVLNRRNGSVAEQR